LGDCFYASECNQQAKEKYDTFKKLFRLHAASLVTRIQLFVNPR
jgi:hypothetical protein